MKAAVTVSELVGLLCYRRDGQLTAYCRTFEPDWKDPTVTDLEGYRMHFLRQAQEDENARAVLVGCTPDHIQDLVSMWRDAFNSKHRRIYRGGL